MRIVFFPPLSLTAKLIDKQSLFSSAPSGVEINTPPRSKQEVIYQDGKRMVQFAMLRESMCSCSGECKKTHSLWWCRSRTQSINQGLPHIQVIYPQTCAALDSGACVREERCWIGSHHQIGQQRTFLSLFARIDSNASFFFLAPSS